MSSATLYTHEVRTLLDTGVGLRVRAVGHRKDCTFGCDL